MRIPGGTMTDLIFDLYGTLVDIHTEENDLVWEKTALYFGFYGAKYTPKELFSAFQAELKKREASAGQSYECFPDIPFEQVMAQLFQDKGVDNAEALGINAAQLFRISSIEYLHLYPGALEALARLRSKGYRLWLSICEKLYFAEQGMNEPTEGALYVQPSVQGNSVILPNEYGEDSKMNLEVLFNAMLAERERMQQMFNR